MVYTQIFTEIIPTIIYLRMQISEKKIYSKFSLNNTYVLNKTKEY